MQKDIVSICEWMEKWLLSLNVEKCKVMHNGKKNLRYEYSMIDKNGDMKLLTSSECERDLEIIVSNDLKWSLQVRNVVGKANKVLGMLKKTFVSRDIELWLKLNKSLVRPHLEYSVQAWCPTL